MPSKVVSNFITTTETGTYEVLSYTVPSGYKFVFKDLIAGGEPTSWSTTETYLGYAYLQIDGVDYRGIEARGMQGDLCGVYGAGRGVAKHTPTYPGGSFALPIPIFQGVEFGAGAVIKVMAQVATTTSSRWKGTLIGVEEAVVVAIVETITAKSFPMLYLPKPAKAQELISKVEGATITKIVKDYPEELLKTGKAKELRSKWS